MKILCIDDYRENCFIYQKCLKCTTVEVTAVMDAETFIDLAQSIEYDAFIVDYNMPKMDGIELIKLCVPKDKPIAIVTADDNIEKHRQELAEWNLTVIMKPILISKLMAFLGA